MCNRNNFLLKWSSSIICIFYTHSAHAAPSTNDLSQDCYRQFRMASDVRACAEKNLEVSERLLAEKEKKEPRLLNKWLEDEYFKADARKYTPISNREFEKYKIKYCNFSMSVMGDADLTAHEIRRLSCVASLNLHYIEQLKADLSYIQWKLD
ncbi:hypothetical protein [Acetobacter papayae]|uniref:hypothetical protein n=1 Tax=Acetobacter papayae TaxID=1076592 RepID=UPI0039E75C81